MQDVAVVTALNARSSRMSAVLASVPTLAETALVTGSALLLVLSFPDFDLWWLAWIGVAPLLLAVATTGKAFRAFWSGLIWGTIFFYGTCWWLTYPMIHYAPVTGGHHIPPGVAYALLLLPVLLVALFPALFSLLLFRVIRRFGLTALLLAPVIWVSIDMARYVVTGQVWNAIGYSQAFHPLLIQSARWGGVYAVSLTVTAVNSVLALAILRKFPAAAIGFTIVVLVAILSYDSKPFPPIKNSGVIKEAAIVAVQPDVPMEPSDGPGEAAELLDRHIALSTAGLSDLKTKYGRSVDLLPRLIVWPESPMNFSYSRDPHLQHIVGDFARANRASVLLNSLEPAPGGGGYNSAILINENGEKVAQYDKIRLMPFGEYVPLPQWLPGASSVRGIVGEFTPGSSYTLMPLGDLRAGVFICIEAAHPSIASSFVNRGADVLVNISNDGYLGPTPVMRQHLANAVFRAVENNRPLVRVTNSGISAFISSAGQVWDQTAGFQQAERTWTLSKGNQGTTFYARHGELFVYFCGLITAAVVAATFIRNRRRAVAGSY